MKTIKPDPLISILRVCLFILLTVLTVRSFAQEDGNKPESPYFFVISSDPATDLLPLKSTRADVNITGVIADVAITQEYRNEGTNPLEAIYTFPASTNAAVYFMEMVIGDRRIVAKIHEKQKARDQYERAKSEGKRASLLEQYRPNVFQMNVANIMPGDLVQVTLKYTELLVPEAGTYRFVYPTVVGPRYSGESSDGVASAFVKSPYTKAGTGAAHAFNLSCNLSMGMPLQHVGSTTHKIVTSFKAPGVAEVSLAPAEVNAGNRDFVLDYKLAGENIEGGLMLYQHGDENFFLLMVQPPKRIVKDEIPPREYIFIVDVSGSMHGFPINTSKTLLRNLITNLRPEDRFNVLVFESGAYWLADESLPAVLENIGKATAFLDRQHGGGGTNLLAAMNKAMSFPRHAENLSRSFIVVTDGYVNVEKEVFEIIRTKSDKANTFAFGIGSSVNRYIIEGMSHVGMTEPFIVLNEQEAGKAAEKFRQYINNPVLTQVRKSFAGFDVYDVEPLSIPDVLAERPVIIYGKYRGAPKGVITIEGATGRRKHKISFDVSSVKPDKKHAALRYLWARKKIQMLDDYAHLDYHNNSEQMITQLGLKYNLLTAYTSFVAIEELRVNEGNVVPVKQPLPLPEGVPNSAVGFELEVDEEATAFSFHKKIELPADLDKPTKRQIESDIETALLPEINAFLAANNVTLESIEVTVDMNGEVALAAVRGKNLSKDVLMKLERLVKKQQYTRYKLFRVWKYRIVF